MMYKEIRVQEIPCLSALKDRQYNLYVGPELSQFDRRRLAEVESRYKVLYLYDFFAKLSSESLSYNFPGVAFPESFSAKTIYESILESIDVKLDLEKYNIIRFDGESFVIYQGSERISETISYLVNKGLSFKTKTRRKCCMRNIPFPHARFNDIEGKPFNLYEQVEEDIRFSIKEDKSDTEIDALIDHEMLADHDFDAEMSKAALEVRQSIADLLLNGFPVEIIKSWLDQSYKLSRLRITKQYKILLVDYDKEVKMGPLPKTVFMFYLRHPEGVEFTFLQDHVKELLEIYGHVSVNDDPDQMNKSISALVDPFNNSINEKCAAIKKAFLLQIANDIAKHYYVTGQQGGAKLITLDRNLVEWECEL